MQRAIDREELREYLNPVYDLERLISKDYISVSKSKRSDRHLKVPSECSHRSKGFYKNCSQKRYRGSVRIWIPLEDLYTLIECSY